MHIQNASSIHFHQRTVPAHGSIQSVKNWILIHLCSRTLPQRLEVTLASAKLSGVSLIGAFYNYLCAAGDSRTWLAESLQWAKATLEGILKSEPPLAAPFWELSSKVSPKHAQASTTCCACTRESDSLARTRSSSSRAGQFHFTNATLPTGHVPPVLLPSHLNHIATLPLARGAQSNWDPLNFQGRCRVLSKVGPLAGGLIATAKE